MLILLYQIAAQGAFGSPFTKDDNTVKQESRSQTKIIGLTI